MGAVDYTDAQTKPVSKFPNMPAPTASESVSRDAQHFYTAAFGARSSEVHVSGSRFAEGPWYLSPAWIRYVERWPSDKAVFVGLTPEPRFVGWLYFSEVKERWTSANSGGHDISGPFRDMKDFQP